VPIRVARWDLAPVDIPAKMVRAEVHVRSADAFLDCGTRISEMMLDILGVEDFSSVPSLDPFTFSRVFVLAFTGAYEWQRGAGWRKLTGEDIQGSQPSFDELKAVLGDPEWLADPDDKAMKVAAECLREMRGNGDAS
jgi:hypothetical protein